ncbi:PEP-CTERM sorting domain-containing protein [Nostocales cyanobacterium LEGE 11386]|nr:PEP-CTERM sorting domain-containing protein [Nostocales cyanobacterium LEGE 11386]
MKISKRFQTLAIATTLLVLGTAVDKTSLAQAATIYNTLEQGTPDFSITPLNNARRFAQPILIGNNNAITSATLQLTRYGMPEGNIAVQIWDDIDGVPRAVVGELGALSNLNAIPQSPLLPPEVFTAFTFDDNIISSLNPNQTYYVVLNYANSNVLFDAGNLNNTNFVGWGIYESPEGANGAREALVSIDRGITWFDIANPEANYFSISVEATTVPEPALILGLGTIMTFGFMLKRTRKTKSWQCP